VLRGSCLQEQGTAVWAAKLRAGFDKERTKDKENCKGKKKQNGII
jgi:hypothetical protein